jgi:hypothetical protein
MSIDYEKNNKDRIPFEHYKKIFSELNPIEAAERCNLPYDEGTNEFSFRLMQQEYRIQFPSGEIYSTQGEKVDAYNFQILVMRYLNEGKYFKPTGKLLTYRDIPWGEVYYPNFQGRCIRRLSFTFGTKIDLFEKAMEHLGAQKIEMGDSAYKFEFMNNLCMYFILWGGDEDFPPSSQILFDDNFPFAFTAEDIAVVGDVSIGILKDISKQL